MDFKRCIDININKKLLYHHKVYENYYLLFDKIEPHYLDKHCILKCYKFHAYDLKTFTYVKDIKLFFSMIEVGIKKNEFLIVVYSSPEEEAKALLMR